MGTQTAVGTQTAGVPRGQAETSVRATMAVLTEEAPAGFKRIPAATTLSTIAVPVTEARGRFIPSPAATTSDARMPAAHATLLFKAEVWKVRQRAFEVVRVLADTASEAQLCTEDYYAEAVPARVNIQGVNSSAIRTSIGCSYISVSTTESRHGFSACQ